MSFEIDDDIRDMKITQENVYPCLRITSRKKFLIHLLYYAVTTHSAYIISDMKVDEVLNTIHA